MTIKKLLADTDSAELQSWMTYYKVEPYGQEWLQTARICSTLDACHRTKGQVNPPAYYMPIQRSLQQKQQSPGLMKATMELAAKSFNRASAQRQKRGK